mmetsp:Transcript_31057/g.90255  ORF Transcript_31057/g.90255 Transcript_31057/m.90255 type:complete len:306 (-) Transcript_31057:1027-1944(-)
MTLIGSSMTTGSEAWGWGRVPKREKRKPPWRTEKPSSPALNSLPQNRRKSTRSSPRFSRGSGAAARTRRGTASNDVDLCRKAEVASSSRPAAGAARASPSAFCWDAEVAAELDACGECGSSSGDPGGEVNLYPDGDMDEVLPGDPGDPDAGALRGKERFGILRAMWPRDGCLTASVTTLLDRPRRSTTWAFLRPTDTECAWEYDCTGDEVVVGEGDDISLRSGGTRGGVDGGCGWRVKWSGSAGSRAAGAAAAPGSRWPASATGGGGSRSAAGSRTQDLSGRDRVTDVRRRAGSREGASSVPEWS